MAYMDEQAQERENIRRQFLGAPRSIGQEDPRAPTPRGVQIPQESTALFESIAQFLAQSMRPDPSKIKVDQMRGLEVPETSYGRPSSGESAPWQGGGDNIDIGSMFDQAKQRALEGMQKGAAPAARSTTGAAERAQRLRDSTPGPYAKGQAAVQYVQDKVPGLKPAIDTSVPKEGEPPRTMAYPSEPAARAYIEQQRTDIPPIVMTEKGTAPAGYEEDIKFLQERGGHNSKLVDGKIVDAPLTEEGDYKMLEPEMAARLAASGRAFEAETGKKAVYGEFSRGPDVQKVYRDRFEAGGGRAARPGQSRHQHGGAGDIQGADYRDWLTQHKDTYGLHFPFSDDKVHVQYDPAYKGQTHIKPVQSSITKDLPPWDTSKPPVWTQPVPAPDTQWPDPSKTTPVAAQPPGPIAAGGDKVLADQRAEYKAHADANPTFREHAAAIMSLESSSPEGQQGTFEAMLNRVKSNGRPINDAIDPNYHADYMVRNRGKFETRLKEIQNNPQLKAKLYDLQDKAFAGSNVSKLATDYASKGTADKSAQTSTETYASPDGQRFFRKDRDPNEDGPGQVAANQKWHKETSEALARPGGTGGPPVATPADVGSPQAMARDVLTAGGAPAGTTPGTVVTREPATEAPVQPAATAAGAGSAGSSSPPATSAIRPPTEPGSRTPEEISKSVAPRPANPLEVAPAPKETTPAEVVAPKEATPDEVFAGDKTMPAPETAAASTTPAPVAAVPPVAVTPSPLPAAAAPVVPPPAPAKVAPPPVKYAPPPPPARAAPAATQAAPAVTPPLTPDQVKKPLTGLDRARDMVDKPLRDIVKKEHLSQVPAEYLDKSPRQIRDGLGMFGGVAMTKMEPLFSQYGVGRQDVDKALSMPPLAPGKRSDVQGTSGSTDFSARGRMPLAPPGLETGLTAKSRLPPATGPSTANMSPYKDFQPYKGEIEDRRGDPGTGKRMLAKSLGMEGESPHADYHWSFAPDARERASQDTPLSRAAGLQDIIKGEEATNAARALEASREPPPDIPPLTPEEIKELQRSGTAQQFSGDGKTTPRPQERIDPTAPMTETERDNVEVHERLMYNIDAQKEGRPERMPLHGPVEGRRELPANGQVKSVPTDETRGLPDLPSQRSQGQQPLPPSIADALVKSVKDQGRPPIDMKPNPEALPVLPATQVAPPQPGAPGGPLSLAPPGLTEPGGGPFQTAMGAPGTQGGAISMLGVIPQIQPATFSTPLIDQQAAQPTIGQGTLSPIPWDTIGSWGWGGGSGPSSGIGDFGGGGGFSGGGGMFGGGGGMFPMPITWGG